MASCVVALSLQMGAAVSVRARRSTRRAGEEGEDVGEQRDLGGAAVGLPDGGGAAEPARDGRGHHHRALGRRRPPRRPGRRGQGPVAGT